MAIAGAAHQPDQHAWHGGGHRRHGLRRRRELTSRPNCRLKAAVEMSRKADKMKKQKTKPATFCPNHICLQNGIHIIPHKNPDGSIAKESAELIRAAMKVPMSFVCSFRTMGKARRLSMLVPAGQAHRDRDLAP